MSQQLTTNADLVQRASQVIPSTMYGHMSVQRMMPDGYPQFFERAEGCRLWDVDGNKYIDLMCAYGPMILGYQHPEVEAAADAQRKKLNTTKAEKGFRFCQTALQNGMYIHPWHNWFLSTAHTESDIEQVLDATDKAFAEVGRK